MTTPDFVVLIPARMASQRLPNKPLLDIGGKPMIVRVAQQATKSAATRVTVAADDPAVLRACVDSGVEALLTDTHHASGSDRLAQACSLLQLPDDTIVVNVQGDEPLIEPALINQVAQALAARPDCVMSTAAHVITQANDWLNPNIVKVVLDGQGGAAYFSRAPIPWARDSMQTTAVDRASKTDDGGSVRIDAMALPDPKPLRHVGIYAYRVGFLKTFPTLPPCASEAIESLEQLRVLWHGHKIAVHLSDEAPTPGVDTEADLANARAQWVALAASRSMG